MWKIQDLKQNINSISSLTEIDPERVRLFFGGKECKNDNELWVYMIETDSKVQMMYREL
jgi:hypothetical protein